MLMSDMPIPEPPADLAFELEATDSRLVAPKSAKKITQLRQCQTLACDHYLGRCVYLMISPSDDFFLFSWDLFTGQTGILGVSPKYVEREYNSASIRRVPWRKFRDAVEKKIELLDKVVKAVEEKIIEEQKEKVIDFPQPVEEDKGPELPKDYIKHIDIQVEESPGFTELPREKKEDPGEIGNKRQDQG